MKLSKNYIDQWVKILKINSNDKLIINKLNSIGIIENEEVFILNKPTNKNIIHLMIRNIEYAFRIDELSILDVEILKNK